MLRMRREKVVYYSYFSEWQYNIQTENLFCHFRKRRLCSGFSNKQVRSDYTKTKEISQVKFRELQRTQLSITNLPNSKASGFPNGRFALEFGIL